MGSSYEIVTLQKIKQKSAFLSTPVFLKQNGNICDSNWLWGICTDTSSHLLWCDDSCWSIMFCHSWIMGVSLRDCCESVWITTESVLINCTFEEEFLSSKQSYYSISKHGCTPGAGMSTAGEFYKIYDP